MEEKNFEREVLDRLIRLETKLDAQDYTLVKSTAELALNNSEQNKKDIEELKQSNVWLIRTIIALVITSAFYIVFNIKG